MTSRTPHTWSIRRRVLAWLFAGIALVFTANMVGSYYGNRKAADRAYDQLLLASASAIAERTVIRDEGLWVDIPYAALNMLASTAQDRVFYAVSALNGAVITGYDDLPPPPNSSRTDTDKNLLFYDAVYKGAPIRVVALKTFVIGSKKSGYALIRVAQTEGDRQSLALSLLRQSAVWALLIPIFGGLAVWLGISFGLRPLDHLREALGRRSPDDVRPLMHDVPTEFKPLVGAMNDMLMRIENGLDSMQRFISDASHQLKTPLAGLQIQTEMALRESDPKALHDSLNKINISVLRTSRLVKQLLAHARVTEPTTKFGEVDLARIARDAISALTPKALERNIDLGFAGETQVLVQGDPTLLGEMIVNLIDNALNYPPHGSVVTLSVQEGETPAFTIDDNGPGIPHEKRGEVFDRFVRLEGAQADGCGLGLAIVQEIAATHGAQVTLGDSPSGGLRVRVTFPPSDR